MKRGADGRQIDGIYCGFAVIFVRHGRRLDFAGTHVTCATTAKEFPNVVCMAILKRFAWAQKHRRAQAPVVIRSSVVAHPLPVPL